MTLAFVAISLSVFVASVLLGYLWYRVRFGVQASKPILMPNMAVRIKTSSGMYRSRFAGESGSKLRFESLLSRQSFVPIRVGELVTIEAATNQGIVLFRSRVVEREEATHDLVIERPKEISHVDRRDAARFPCNDMEVTVKLDGLSAQLIDLSAKGAKLRTRCEYKKGERVSIEFPWQSTEIGAWVIDIASAGLGENACSVLRIVFEEPAKLPRKSALGKIWV